VEDPRPLTREPLSLDLVNTVWIADGRRRDLLAEPGGAGVWLAAIGHPGAPDGVRDRAALVQSREAIRAVAEQRDDGAALNAVLAHGRLAERLGPDGPERSLEVDHERWRVPWLAAQDLLELLRSGPERIRRCAGHGCVLHFYDASRGGRRQWCSMASCGNRAKARRHHERERANGRNESPGRSFQPV
jgi:predicted RNA-binding Zn ribbon-like protein